MADAADISDRSALRTLGEILSREIHTLIERPDLLRQQVHNRLQWEDEAVRAAIHGDGDIAPDDHPWLRTTRPFTESRALVFTLAGHEDAVASCALSSDGDLIVSAGRDDRLTTWDAATGREILSIIAGQGGLNDCSFDLEARTVATAGNDGTVKVWDVRTGSVVATLERHDGPVHSCALSSDGRLVVSASQDGMVGIWRVENPRRLRTLEGHEGPVHACALTPDGSRIISAGGGRMPGSGRTRRWQSSSAAREVAEHAGAGHDYAIRVWHLLTGRLLHALEGHQSSVYRCAVSPDGSLLATAAHDGVRVWEIETGRQIRAIEPRSGSPFGCAVSPDGSSLAIGAEDGGVELWDLALGEHVRTLLGHGGRITGLAHTPNGRFLVSASGDTTLKVWKVDAEPDPEQHPDAYRSTVISCAAIPGTSSAVLASPDRTSLYVWDLEGGGHPRPLTEDGHEMEMGIGDCVAAPDGSFVVSGGWDSVAKAWDLAGTELQAFRGHDTAIYACSVSPDGTTVVSAGMDRTVRAWDVRNGQEIATFHGHTAAVSACTVGPDGAVVLSGGDDGALRAGDLKTGQGVSVVEDAGKVTGCSVSPDGKYFVSVGEREGRSFLEVCDYQTREPLRSLSAGRGRFTGCAVSPDGAFVATAGMDHAVRLWDVAAGTEIAAVYLPSGVVTVAFHPSRPLLVCGGPGGPQLIEAPGIGYGPLVASVLQDEDTLEARCPACVDRFAVAEGLLGEELSCPSCGHALRLNPFSVALRAPATERVRPEERDLDRALRAMGGPPQQALGVLLQGTNLSVEWADAGVFHVAVDDAAGRRLTVQEQEDGTAWVMTALPELPKRFGRGKAIEHLVRAGFYVHYVRAAILPDGTPALLAALPLHLLDPPVLEGLVRGVAALGNVSDSSDLASGKSWERRISAAAEVISDAVSLDADAEREKIMTVDRSNVPDRDRDGLLTFSADLSLLDADTGRQIKLGITPWIAPSRGSISFIYCLPWLVKDLDQEGEHILRTNASLTLAKLTFWPTNKQVTAIYSTPRFDENTRDQALQDFGKMIAYGAMPLGKM